MTDPVEAMETVMAAVGFPPSGILPPGGRHLAAPLLPRPPWRTAQRHPGHLPAGDPDDRRAFSAHHGRPRRRRVRVPRVLASDCAAGWMLIEDLGPQTLGEWGKGRPWSEVAPWFDTALEIAARIAQLPVTPDDGPLAQNPRLGTGMLRRELTQTWISFWSRRACWRTRSWRPGCPAALDTLCATLGGEPPVPCHRDFMVRNLMPLEGGGLAVLDHQDLRLGPAALRRGLAASTTRFSHRPMPRMSLVAALTTRRKAGCSTTGPRPSGRSRPSVPTPRSPAAEPPGTCR